MVITALTTALLFAATPPPQGTLCELSVASARVYELRNYLTDDCHPESIVTMESPPAGTLQKAFLMQYKANKLNREGFRTTLAPWAGQTVIIARLKATQPQLLGLTFGTSNPRYHTRFSDNNDEVMISLTNNLLVLSRIFVVNGTEFAESYSHYFAATPSLDVMSTELDTRIVYNSPMSYEGALSIQVCANRGAVCHDFNIAGVFGSTSPEIYMGDGLPVNPGALRARYCRLPAMTSTGTGYTTTCPGPGSPPVAWLAE